jgi:hypothetical protein
MIFILIDPSIPGYLVKIKVGASTPIGLGV